MSDGNPVSRREALRRVSLLGLTVVGGSFFVAACSKEQKAKELDCTDTVGLPPADLATRENNQYVDKSPDQSKVCAGCQLYKPPAAEGQCGGCTVVKGPINPKGYCKLYTPKVAT